MRGKPAEIELIASNDRARGFLDNSNRTLKHLIKRDARCRRIVALISSTCRESVVGKAERNTGNLGLGQPNIVGLCKAVRMKRPIRYSSGYCCSTSYESGLCT